MSNGNANGIFSNHYAVVIGTGTDLNGETSSHYQSTINDAVWFADVLSEPYLCAFPTKNVKLLTGKDATRHRIVEELELIRDSITDSANNDSFGEISSTVVVFFSCHGTKQDGKTFLVPYGYKSGQPPKSHAIDGDFLFKELQSLMADKILLLLNACYSGGVMPKLGDNNVAPGQNVTLFDQRQLKGLSQGKGFAFLSASQPLQAAETAYLPRFSSKRYSPFTIGLARGFLGIGKAKDGNGLVYVTDLYGTCNGYVFGKTKGRQQPHFDYKGDNFAVGRHRLVSTGKFPLLGDDLLFDVDEVWGKDETAMPAYQSAPNITTNIGGSIISYGNNSVTGGVHTGTTYNFGGYGR